MYRRKKQKKNRFRVRPDQFSSLFDVVSPRGVCVSSFSSLMEAEQFCVELNNMFML